MVDKTLPWLQNLIFITMTKTKKSINFGEV